MAGEPLVSGAMESISGLCGPSLFPRTVRVSSVAHFPSDIKDLDSIHNCMKSMVSRNSEVLLEEAKLIVDRGSELLNTKYPAFIASLGIDEAAPVWGNVKAQERRPGLGRKRARFCLKPNSSQPSESLQPSLDIDQLQDPEEYFAVVEKLENAKKEIEKQKGGSLSVINETNLSQNTRKRRPGLLGKTATYKHRYSSVLSANEDTFASSQEPLEPNLPAAPNCDLLNATDSSDVELQETSVSGSITNTENRVNKILDDILSGSNEDLDGDGAMVLLQERLHIKPIELSTLSMLDFPDIGRTDFKALGKSLSKPRKTSLDVQNLVKRTTKGTPSNSKQREGSPVDSSPTPPRSPFASISLLKKRILQSNPLRDPFSPLSIDPSTLGNLSSGSHSSGNQVTSGSFDTQKEINISEMFQSDTEDATGKLDVSDKSSEKMISKSSDRLSDLPMDKNSSRGSPYVDDRRSGSHSNLAADHDDFFLNREGTKNTGNDEIMYQPDTRKENVLEKRMLQSNPLRDPFSPLNVDLLTPRNLSSGNQMNSGSDEVNVLKTFDIAEKFQSDTEDATRKIVVSDKSLEKVTTRSLDGLSDLPVDKKSSKGSPYVDDRQSGSRSNLGVHYDDFEMDLEGRENTENDDLMDQPDMRKENVNNRAREVFSSTEKHGSADYSAEPAFAVDGHGSGQVDKNVEDMPSTSSSAEMDINIEGSTFSENVNIEQRLYDDDSDRATTEGFTTVVPPTATETELIQQTEKAPSVSRQQKRKRSPVGKYERKALSRRQSIADNGTLFENGVRKSRRVRMRPLEYWKGEKFLYGRIGDSLKLIGVKYISPTSKVDGKLKVKPLIEDECNEQLELAARH